MKDATDKFFQIIVLLSVVLIAGCATMQADWKKTESVNTVDAYREFLKHYPQSGYANEAKSRIEGLKYEEAKKKDQIGSYEEFLGIYPQSKYLQDVKDRLNSKIVFLKGLPNNRIKIEYNDKQDVMVESTLRNILTGMKLEIVSPSDTDFDLKLKSESPTLDMLGTFASGGSLFGVWGYSIKVDLYHQKAGFVFEKTISCPVNIQHLVEKGGQIISDPSRDRKKEERDLETARKTLPKWLQVEIPTYFEQYLGKGIELLIENLKNEDKLLREQSAKKLGELGKSQAIEPLIAILNDESKDVQRSALEALKKITGNDYGTDSTKWLEWLEKNKPK